MYSISNSVVVNWVNNSGYHVPVMLDLVCPSCRKAVTFAAEGWNGHTAQGMPLPMRCPRCAETVSLIRLGGTQNANARLYIDAENPARPAVLGLDLVPDEVISPKLKKAYQSALNVLAIGEAEATAVTCRRVLEGITRSILPKDAKQTNLYRSIAALTKEHDKLAKPLVELSDTLRVGGNLGAHFNDESETSIEDARRMMDLLDYLITYLFVLPTQIHRFKTEVLREEPTASSEPAEPAASTEPTESTA